LQHIKIDDANGNKREKENPHTLLETRLKVFKEIAAVVLS
jgi:hypothetical protein